MKDFILAAAPWIAIGLCLAIFIARHSEKEKNSGKTYESEGIAIGMCMGVALGTMFEGGLAIGISVGMLIGLCVGSRISKQADGEENRKTEKKETEQ